MVLRSRLFAYSCRTLILLMLQGLLAATPCSPDSLAPVLTADCAVDWFGEKSTGPAAVRSVPRTSRCPQLAL
eukprot:SAG22_NODE_6467_length_850_cov_1.487350_1_plen_71_part_10